MIYKSFLFVVLLLSAVPLPALAHGNIAGMDTFFGGVLHPVLVPLHWLLLLASGLYMGQQGIERNRAAFKVFVIATAIGLIGAWFVIITEMVVLQLSLAAIIGLFTAANFPLGRYLIACLMALVGFIVGVDSTQEALAGKAKLATLVGSGIGIYLLFVCAMELSAALHKKFWQAIGIRVVGSWITASSILVLALYLFPGSIP